MTNHDIPPSIIIDPVTTPVEETAFHASISFANNAILPVEPYVIDHESVYATSVLPFI
jgi:hypothetical protein